MGSINADRRDLTQSISVSIGSWELRSPLRCWAKYLPKGLHLDVARSAASPVAMAPIAPQLGAPVSAAGQAAVRIGSELLSSFKQGETKHKIKKNIKKLKQFKT